MDARQLLERIEARGGVATVKHEGGAAKLNIAPRSLALELAGEVARFKPSLLELLERKRREGEPLGVADVLADALARAACLRLQKLEHAQGIEGARLSIVSTARRLKRERPDFWRRLDAGSRHDLKKAVFDSLNLDGFSK